MRIAVDVMGSDHGPTVVTRGAIKALGFDPALTLTLVGDESAIAKALEGQSYDKARVAIVHAPTFIAMDEHPVEAIRAKRDSSLIIATKLVGDGVCDAIVCAGSTGAQVASSTLMLRNLPGVQRAGIAALVPSVTGRVVVIDVGASVTGKPQNLLQYGVMGSLYAKSTMGIENPRVGLLSVGSESTKGNPLVKETNALFAESDLNFIGNIEGHEVFLGKTDVVVCDGFVGNILLKIAEGMAEVMFGVFHEGAVASDLVNHAAYKTAFQAVRKRVDWTETGGAQLLGVNGVSVIAHGRSNERAVENAVTTAARLVASGLNQHIVTALGRPVSAAS